MKLQLNADFQDLKSQVFLTPFIRSHQTSNSFEKLQIRILTILVTIQRHKPNFLRF